MAREFTELHIWISPAPYRWEIRRGHDPIFIMYSYASESEALKAGQVTLERLKQREALNKG